MRSLRVLTCRAGVLIALSACTVASPSSTRELRVGRLDFTACDIGSTRGAYPKLGALCTELEVPEDWSRPQARRIRLRVALIRAQDEKPLADPVIFLDGGPGGAATEDYPAIAGAFEGLRRRRHIVLMDQRGTGGSHALKCPDDDKQPTQQNAQEADMAAFRQALQRCVTALSANSEPRFYTTTETLRDLEALRTALHVSRFNLLGISYGTRVAQQYAQHYPNSVRALILDSPVPNRVALPSDHARNLDAALRAQFARCVSDAACHRRFGDPWSTLASLRASLHAHPQPVQLHDPSSHALSMHTLGERELVGWARIQAYNPLTVALMPLALDEAAHGRYQPLLAQELLVSDELGERLMGAMSLSVSCAEDVDLLKSDQADAQTLLSNSLIEFLTEACRIWPRGTRPQDFHDPLRGNIPTLILSGENDPVTPPAYAREIAATLSQSRVLLAPAQGHTVIVSGCMPQLVQEFITSLAPAKLDARCLQRLGPTPFLLDYTGGAP